MRTCRICGVTEDEHHAPEWIEVPEGCACDPVACQQNRKEYSIEELTKAVQEGSIRTVKYEECISWDEAMKLLPETRNKEA